MIDLIDRLRVCARFDPDQADAIVEIEGLRSPVLKMEEALDEVRDLVAGSNFSASRYRKFHAAYDELSVRKKQLSSNT